jgi:UDP-glucose 4-epimerase
MGKVLVTGGLGYIGSHTVIKLIENGYEPVIIDNLSNSKRDVLNKIKLITGANNIPFIYGDIKDKKMTDWLLQSYKIDVVIHFAAYKSVSESIQKPIEYYENNVGGTINLIKYMKNAGIRNIIFSSSCTVYGEPDHYPVHEELPTKEAKTPYGITKGMCEKILLDAKEVNSIALRYFNPIGNHESGIIYENPNGVPENLMPYIIGVIEGKYDKLRVWGDDYNTPDGTAIRDYIDVNDLADAHVKALDIVGGCGHNVINVGTGNGISVMEIIKAFQAEGVEVPYEIHPRRSGDIEKIYGNIEKAKTLMGWEPQRDISDSVRSILKKIEVTA